MAGIAIAEVADTGFDLFVHEANILLAEQKDKPKISDGKDFS